MKAIITENQINQMLENLLTEDHSIDKALNIIQKFYPGMWEAIDNIGIDEFTNNMLKPIVSKLQKYQVFTTHNLNWILEQINQKNDTIVEDMDDIGRLLKMFKKYRNKIISDGGDGDLWVKTGANEKRLNYNDKGELAAMVTKYQTSEDIGSDDIISSVKHYVNTGAFKLIGENSNWYIVEIRKGATEAVVDIQRGSNPNEPRTLWCTRTGGTYFDSYTKQGPLVMLFDKRIIDTNNPMRMLQFHWESSQFMDINDKRIDTDTFYTENSDVYEIIYAGIIDILMDPTITTLLPINIEKIEMPKEAKSIYKYKLETLLKPIIGGVFNVPEGKVKIIDYGKYGITAKVWGNKVYNPREKTYDSTDTEYNITPKKYADMTIRDITTTLRMLDNTNIVNTSNIDEWIGLIDITKLKAMLKQHNTDIAIYLQQGLVKFNDDIKLAINFIIENKGVTLDGMLNNIFLDSKILDADIVLDYMYKIKTGDVNFTKLNTKILTISAKHFNIRSITLADFNKYSEESELVAIKLG